MKLPIATNIWLDPPKHALEGQALPRVIQQFTLVELCRAAQIACRVSGGAQDEKRVSVCESVRHFQVVAIPWSLSYVGVSADWKLDRLRALRVLEILAYAFHDYEARECVSFRGLFAAQKPAGRPPVSGRAQTARERMATMRARRAATAPMVVGQETL
jgi:hypothetical protein